MKKQRPEKMDEQATAAFARLFALTHDGPIEIDPGGGYPILLIEVLGTIPESPWGKALLVSIRAYPGSGDKRIGHPEIIFIWSGQQSTGHDQALVPYRYNRPLYGIHRSGFLFSNGRVSKLRRPLHQLHIQIAQPY